MGSFPISGRKLKVDSAHSSIDYRLIDYQVSFIQFSAKGMDCHPVFGLRGGVRGKWWIDFQADRGRRKKGWFEADSKKRKGRHTGHSDIVEGI